MLEPRLFPSGMYGLQAVLADTHPSEEKALGFSVLCSPSASDFMTTKHSFLWHMETVPADLFFWVT